MMAHDGLLSDHLLGTIPSEDQSSYSSMDRWTIIMVCNVSGTLETT